jgi:hypothetical protein
MSTMPSDTAAVAQSVQAAYDAILSKNQKQLESLVSDQLSYCHSVGRLENKTQFIAGALNPKTVWKSLGPAEQTITVAGDTAVVRHVMTGENTRDGKTNSVRMPVLMVLQKQGEVWKMLARQAYKI